MDEITKIYNVSWVYSGPVSTDYLKTVDDEFIVTSDGLDLAVTGE